MKFYARMGNKVEVYFCRAPWVRVSWRRFFFEKLLRNKCLATSNQLKARGMDLQMVFEEGNASIANERDLKNIKMLLKAERIV